MNKSDVINYFGGSESHLGMLVNGVFDFANIIQPLFIFTFGIVIYSMFISKYYGFLARRDVLVTEDDDDWGVRSIFGKIAEITSHSVQSLFIIPLLVFFWFAVLTVLLILLSKNHTPETLMLTSMSIVASVRVTSYYKQSLSKDLAKLIPLALLAVFATDISYFSYERSVEIASQLPQHAYLMFNYLIFVVLLEFIMRIYEFFVKLKKNKHEDNKLTNNTEKTSIKTQ